MMNKRKAMVWTVLLLACALVATGVVAAPAATTVDRWVIGGGGGHIEAAGRALDGTIGQPVVGWVQSAGYELSSGFWGGLANYRVYLPLVVRNGP
jgi:hypothetical protein